MRKKGRNYWVTPGHVVDVQAGQIRINSGCRKWDSCFLYNWYDKSCPLERDFPFLRNVVRAHNSGTCEHALSFDNSYVDVPVCHGTPFLLISSVRSPAYVGEDRDDDDAKNRMFLTAL